MLEGRRDRGGEKLSKNSQGECLELLLVNKR